MAVTKLYVKWVGVSYWDRKFYLANIPPMARSCQDTGLEWDSQLRQALTEIYIILVVSISMVDNICIGHQFLPFMMKTI